MIDIQTITITVLSSVLASSGLWSVLLFRMQKHAEKAQKNTAERKMLLALAHDRIYYLCERILSDSVSGIDIDEYDNLRILYEGYKNLGGNGTCERLFNEVSKLPLVGAGH